MKNEKELYTFLLHNGFLATDKDNTFIHAGGQIKAVLQVNNCPPAYVEIYRKTGRDTRKYAPKGVYLWKNLGESSRIEKLQEILNNCLIN